MRNLRAIILLVWRKWTRYNSGRIMRVSVPTRILASLCRVFLFGICLSDRCSCHDRVARSGINRIPARHLSMNGGAEHEEANHDRRQNFQRI